MGGTSLGNIPKKDFYCFPYKKKLSYINIHYLWENFTFVFLIWVGLQITILENKQKLNQCGNILEVVTTAKANFGQLVEKCQTCLFQKDFSSVTFPGGSTDHGIKKIVPAPCHRNGADAKIFYLTQVRSLSTFFTDSTDGGKVSRKKWLFFWILSK